MKTAQKFEIQEVIKDGEGHGIGVILTDGTRLMISHSEHQVLRKILNVKVKVPSLNDPHLKMVDSPLSLKDNGEIIQLPTYWRRGDKVGDTLVTKTFRFKEDMDTQCQMPFGKTVIGDAEICLVTDEVRGTKRIIINFILKSDSNVAPEAEIKIGGIKRENTTFSIFVPGGKGSMIVVNKL